MVGGEKVKMATISHDSLSISHEKLLHYCSFDTLQKILENKTLKLSNLENLNDIHEKKRKGIEYHAKETFVACFSHCQHEIVPFWYNYGGNQNKDKLLLRIKNFAGEFEKCFSTNSFIDGKTYKRKQFDLGILSIQTIDVEYLPLNHDDLNRSYSAPAVLRANSTAQTVSTGVLHDMTLLGHQKSVHWDYEKETRIVCTMGAHYKILFESMYLILDDYFFKDMEIILNPWCDDEFASKVSDYIKQVSLPVEIRETINISKSELDGLLREI